MYIISEVLTQLAKPENLMEQRLNLLEQNVSSLMNVIYVCICCREQYSLKENTEKLSYIKAVAAHSI